MSILFDMILDLICIYFKMVFFINVEILLTFVLVFRI